MQLNAMEGGQQYANQACQEALHQGANATSIFQHIRVCNTSMHSARPCDDY